jgi:cyanate permease
LGLPQALARAAAPFALGVLWSPQGGYASGLWMLLLCSLLAVLALWTAQRASMRAKRG